jgi:hypothetical protein
MRADAVGKVLTAPRTHVRTVVEKVRGKLTDAKVASADCALTDHVVPAVVDKERAFRGAQSPWLLAIEMRQVALVKDNGVPR